MAGLEDFSSLAPKVPYRADDFSSVGLDTITRPSVGQIPPVVDYNAAPPSPGEPSEEQKARDRAGEVVRYAVNPDGSVTDERGQYTRADVQDARAYEKAQESPSKQQQPAAPKLTPLKWDTVANSKKYQDLSYDEQDRIRNRFFVDNIAPKVPTAQLDAVKSSFDNDTAPTIFNRVKWAAGRLVKDLGGSNMPASDPNGFESPVDAPAASTLSGSVMEAYAKLSPEKRDEIAAAIDKTSASPAKRAFADIHELALNPLLAREALKQFPEGPDRPGPTIRSALEKIATPEAVAGALDRSGRNYRVVDNNLKRSLADTYRDLGADFMSGVAGISTAAGQGEKLIGLEKLGQSLIDEGDSAQKYWAGLRSPKGQQEADRKFIGSGDFSSFGKAINTLASGTWEAGDASLGTVASQATQSAPGMIAMGGVGKVVSAGLIKSGAVDWATRLLARTGAPLPIAEKVIDFAANGASFGGAEGVFSGLQNAAQTGIEIRNMDYDKLKESPAFNQFLSEQDPSLPEKQRLELAKKASADAAEAYIFAHTVVTTGGTSALTGGGIFGILNGGRKMAVSGALANTIKGVATEGAQETVQSGIEQYWQNMGKQKFADPNQDPSEGVAEQAISGGVVGGAMGLAGGAAPHAQRQNTSTGEAPKAQMPGEAQPVESSTDKLSKADEKLSIDPAKVDNQNTKNSSTGAPSQAKEAGKAQPAEDVNAPIDASTVLDTVETAAHEAATSPKNDRPEPTAAQQEAGNYKKGHVNLQGLDISIENPTGSTRSGTDANGNAWENTMQSHYGYIKGTVGKDKDHVDAFIGPNPESDQVFVIDQKRPGNGHFDEHKVMLGFTSQAEAESAYKANYAKDWDGIRAITPTTMPEFKAWLKEGDTTKEFANGNATLSPDAGAGAIAGAGADAVPGATPDRRADSTERKRIDEMSLAEARVALKTDELTGLPNRRAYEEAERLPVQTRVDLDGFKAINDTFGHDAGDEILKAVATHLNASKADGRVFRIGGDEFPGEFNSPAEATKAMEFARQKLASQKFTFELPDGSQKIITGVGFSYGHGENSQIAEAGLIADKAAREKAGLRRPRDGSLPEGNARASQGQQADKGRVGNKASERSSPGPATQAEKTPPAGGVSLSGDVTLGTYGVMPSTNNQALTLKKTADGYSLFQGKNEAIDADTGDPITYESVDVAIADLKAELKKKDGRRFLSNKQGIYFAPEFKAAPAVAEKTSATTKEPPAKAAEAAKPDTKASSNRKTAYEGATPAEVESMVQLSPEIGWAEQGGKLLRNSDGDAAGRTNWVPHSSFWPNRPEAIGIGPAKGAIARLKDGLPMSAIQKRFVDYAREYLKREAEQHAKAIVDMEKEALAAATVQVPELDNFNADDLAAAIEIAQDLADDVDWWGKSAPGNEEQFMKVAGYSQEEINEARDKAKNQDATGQGAAGESAGRRSGIVEAGESAQETEKAVAPQTPADAGVSASSVEKIPGTRDIAQRIVNAENAFIASAVEQFKLTKAQATLAWNRLLKEKVVKVDVVGGQYKLKDGRFWGRDVLLRAAGEDAAPALELKSETEAEIKAREEVEAATAAVKAKADKAADAKAQADSERDSFTLTGSNRSADVMAAAGQGGLFDAPAPSSKIEDFGEKIAGARKDYATEYASRMKDAEGMDIASEPLSRTWPEPDYQKLLDGGADPWSVGFAHAARDEVPTKPQSKWKLGRWVSQTTLLRDVTSKIMAGEIPAAKAREKLAGERWSADLMNRVDLYMAVGHEHSLKGINLRTGSYSVFEGKNFTPAKTMWSVEKRAKASAFSNWPDMIANADTRDGAIQAFKEKVAGGVLEKAATEKKTEFVIYSKRTAPGFFIGKKIGTKYIDLKKFDKAPAARTYLSENQDELEKLLAKAKEIPSERRSENSPRVGEDHRNGADVTPEQFQEAFGFRGVQFGNYVEGSRRQADLNEAYDALLDLAGTLGIPAKAISLNGELGLAFGARGKGGINAGAAHYEPGQIVINLTKERGAGSLAHEWFHGLDNYFSRARGQKADYMTLKPYERGDGVRPEMVAAFADVMKAINSTALIQRSRVLDGTRSKDYWSTGHEMAARSFESYVVAKLQDQGASNDYLANIVSEAYWKAATSLGIEKEGSYPYPTAAEIPAVRAAFDHFFNTIQSKETDNGIALHRRGDIPAKGMTAIAVRNTIGHDKQAIIAQTVAEARARSGYKGLTDDQQGAAYKGKVYLIAENLENPLHAQFIYWHEQFHVDFRRRYSGRLGYAKALRTIANNNENVRHQARQWRSDNADESVAELMAAGESEIDARNFVNMLSIEETLADMAGKQGEFIKLQGFKEFIAAVQRLLRNLGLTRLANWMEGKTDAEAIALIASLRKPVAKVSDSLGELVPANSRPSPKPTDTEAFKKWFGESKVVDAEGNPLVVYHGTTADFLAFKEGTGFFSVSPAEANLYGGINSDGANVVPAYLSIKNPVVLQASEASKYKIFDALQSMRRDQDGVIVMEEGKVRWAVVDQPSQIKSAIGNKGTFDSMDANIANARGTPAPTPESKASGPIDAILKHAGGKQFAKYVTEPAYRMLLGLGRYVPTKIKAGIVADYGLPEPYINERDSVMANQINQARKTAGIIEKMSTLSRAQSAIAYQWMTQNDALGDALLDNLPADQQATLREVKKLITDMGAEAVELGQLSADSYAKNKDAYLHRTYRKFALDDTKQDVVAKARAVKVLGEQYKGRGLRDEVKAEDIGYVEKGEKFTRYENRDVNGRIVKVHYQPVGKVMNQEMAAKYADYRQAGTWEVRYLDKPGKVGMWRDFTPEELVRMGEIDEIRYSVAKTLHLMVRDVETGKFFKWIAGEYTKDSPAGLHIVEAPTGRGLSTFSTDDWVQVPSGNIPGTQTPIYGAIAGKYVPAPMWNDLRQVSAAKFQPFGDAFDAVLKFWKLSKTAYSPGTHMNNLISNFLMADYNDVSAIDVVKAAYALGSNWKGNNEESKQLYERYKASGAEIGSYILSETQRETIEPLLEQLRSEVDKADTDGGLLKAASIVNLIFHGEGRQAANRVANSKVWMLTKKASDFAKETYQSEDTLFRMAAFIKAIREGKTDEQAGRFARDAFLNYHINAPWIANARATAFPFIAFAYRAAPMLVKTAAHKPWKFLKYFALAGGLNMLAYSMLGGGDDREKKERALLPNEKSGKIWGVFPRLLRMPWNDARGNPVFLDVRRWIPVGDILDTEQNHSAIPLPQNLMPGGPLMTLAEVFLNKSSFTGKALTLDTDTPTEKAKKIATYLWQAMMPNNPLIPLAYSNEKILDAGKGKTDAFGREQSTAEALLSSIGIKLASYPTDVLSKALKSKYDHDVMELQQEFGKVKREYQQKGITAAELAEKERAYEVKRRELAKTFKEKFSGR